MNKEVVVYIYMYLGYIDVNNVLNATCNNYLYTVFQHIIIFIDIISTSGVVSTSHGSNITCWSGGQTMF